MERLALHKEILCNSCNSIDLNNSAFEPSILYNYKDSICQVILNRPKHMNALNDEMLISLENEAKKWNSSPNIKIILIKGAGDKAFSAGGDIKLFYAWKTAGSSKQIKNYFETLYKLSNIFDNLNPILISLWDGVVMGGGIGLTINSKIKIVTEKARFALPELKIGNSSYFNFLPQLRNNIGYYIGLTGRTLKGAEIVQIGLGDYFVKHDNLKFIEEEIIKIASSVDNIEKIHEIIKKYQEHVDDFYLEESMIKNYFSKDTLEEIWNQLENSNEKDKLWTEKVLMDMKENSPLAMKLTFKQLKKASKTGSNEDHDFHLAVYEKLVEHPDFTEGIRCAVIDKTNKPKWVHKSIFEVKEEDTLCLS